jgi:hypothetical protein
MIFHGYWVKPLGRTIIDPIHFGGLMILRSPCHFKSATEKKKTLILTCQVLTFIMIDLNLGGSTFKWITVSWFWRK